MGAGSRAIESPAKKPQEHERSPPLRHVFNETVVRLVEGLADPARRRRAALVFALGYGALWFIYGVIAKSSQDLNADMAEMVVWTREPALGYSKHPPLLAWILWVWFKVFPLADWAYILLAVATVAIGIYLAIELAAEWLTREKLAAVPFLLAVIPFYNFLGLKFDQNSILIPLWALAMWAMLRALDTRHDGWAALAGLAAAAAMLSKYWSVFLIAALSLTALFHGKRADYFRSRAPWVTALVFLAAVAPHVWWLIRENFPPVTWVTWRRVSSVVSRGAAVAVRMSRRHRRLCGDCDRARAHLRAAVAARARRRILTARRAAQRRDPVLGADPASRRAGASSRRSRRMSGG